MKIVDFLNNRLIKSEKDYVIEIEVGPYELVLLINLGTEKIKYDDTMGLIFNKNGKGIEILNELELKDFKRYEELENKFMFGSLSYSKVDFINDLYEYLEELNLNKLSTKLHKSIENFKDEDVDCSIEGIKNYKKKILDFINDDGKILDDEVIKRIMGE